MVWLVYLDINKLHLKVRQAGMQPVKLKIDCAPQFSQMNFKTGSFDLIWKSFSYLSYSTNMSRDFIVFHYSRGTTVK